MPLTTIWGNANPNVQDAPNDANDDLGNGYQASCGGPANPEPLDFYLYEVGVSITQLESRLNDTAALCAAMAASPACVQGMAAAIAANPIALSSIVGAMAASPAAMQAFAAAIGANAVATSSVWGGITARHMSWDGTKLCIDYDNDGNPAA